MSNTERHDSFFKGNFWALIGQQIIWTAFTVVTFGLGYAYATKKITQWMTNNIIISNRQLGFEASAKKLFLRVVGLYILYLIIIFPTMGNVTTTSITTSNESSYEMGAMMVTNSVTAFIISIALALILQNWLIKGMFFVNEQGSSTYTGTQPMLGFKLVIVTLVSTFSFGLLAPWALVYLIRWYFSNMTISGYRLKFLGATKEIYLKVISLLLLSLLAYAIPVAITMINSHLWWLSFLLYIPALILVAYLAFKLLLWMISQVTIDANIEHPPLSQQIEH